MGLASFWLPAPACHRRSRCSAVQAERLIGAKLTTSAPKPATDGEGASKVSTKGIILSSVFTGQGGFLLGNVVSCIAAILFAFILGAFCRELYSDPAIAGNRHHPIGHQ